MLGVDLVIQGYAVRCSAREADVRATLILAFQALKCFQGSSPARYKVLWPDSFDRNLDQTAEGERTQVRSNATQEEIRALERIEREGWLYRIPDLRHRYAVSLKALHPSAGWRRVAAMLSEERDWLRCSHETARRWEREGIEGICRMPGVGSWRDDCG
jgi:hypothetical protein